MHQWRTGKHQLAGTIGLEGKQRFPLRGPAILGDLCFADAKVKEVGLRQIDPVFLPVDADVLPEIDLLQCSADAVGAAQVFVIGFFAEMYQQAPDRIGRAPAVIE